MKKVASSKNEDSTYSFYTQKPKFSVMSMGIHGSSSDANQRFRNSFEISLWVNVAREGYFKDGKKGINK